MEKYSFIRDKVVKNKSLRKNRWRLLQIESAIACNLRKFKQLLSEETKLMAVVKGEAYGHGMLPVAYTALRAGADWLGVFHLGEAYELRREGILAPILVLGYVPAEDLPEAITKMSFDSYTIPVDKEGTLPVKLFDRKLNFKRLQEKEIPLLICYGEQDDLVDKETALAPLDFIDAEVTAFPKGHGAMATSWSLPGSECSLDNYFGDDYRGPVRFQLDLEQALDKASGKSIKGKSSSKPKNKVKS